eukprot:SAG31_NODE_23458_length_504_cov_0.565432_1_plen_42_part_01
MRSVLAGDAACGKTALLHPITNKGRFPEEHVATEFKRDVWTA